MKRFGMMMAAFVLGVVVASAQPKFDYGDIASGKFSQKSIRGLRSMNDGEHYTTMKAGVISRYAYEGEQQGDVLCNVSELDLKGWVDDYTFSPDEKKILFRLNSRPLYRRSHFSKYVVYDLADKSLVEVDESGDVRYALFSPTGNKVAYVKDNNIFVRDLADGGCVQVTEDGQWNHIINGMPDWVYEEEWGIDHAFCFSPDGEHIAFLKSDESRVKEFGFMKFLTGTTYPELFKYKYPKAGEDNSIVSLHLYSLKEGTTVRVDNKGDEDIYIPFFNWTPDGRLYYFQINRLQNNLEVILKDNQEQRVIYSEQDAKYIDGLSNGTITFLADSDRFLVLSERSGYNHLYLSSVSKGGLKAVTSGEWNVTEVVCATDKRIWYLSTEGSPLRREFYSIGIDGRKKERLSDKEGTYSISPSAGCRYYISYFSNASTPNTVTLHKGDGKLIATLEDNAKLKEYIAEIQLPEKEFFTFTTPRGDVLNAYIKKPADFDPTKKYPVLITQYSGPGSQDVRDRWTIDWEDVLVQHGYIVADCDPRGTGFRSAEFKKSTYGIMGRLETEDQIAFAEYLKTLSYVDDQRVGIYGWSYGGFMALNCILKGADTFKMAISVAPVTSWRFYDSVYTERVNGLPQTNAEGYDEPSPIGYAKNLKGKLLLMHGTADDNVHVQNAYAMVHEFVKAGKQIDMMIYTDDNHSMVPYGKVNVRQKMVEYCLENL
ncbi:MAG: S9 family peptidase [Tidjanibacter sp.]|nr:S9 family peptidase [Tidjanibacter sp.]